MTTETKHTPLAFELDEFEEAAKQAVAYISKLEAINTELLEALGEARHELVTLSGLTASDGLDAYGEAQREGCCPNGAWDCFCEQTFRINTQNAIQKIDTAIAKAHS